MMEQSLLMPENCLNFVYCICSGTHIINKTALLSHVLAADKELECSFQR